MQSAAQPVETGFVSRSVELNGDEYRYQVFVPREFQPSIKWPVILALHGGGEYGRDGRLQTTVGLAVSIRQQPERFQAIVVFPQARADGTPGWQAAGGQAAMLALDRTMAEFCGDPARVYLTGYSAGGNGCWFLAARHPERFAALAVVCGFILEFRGVASDVRYPALAPASAPDPFAYLAGKVAHLPIWLFHGEADEVVAVQESRRMYAALKAIGADVRYTELPGAGHNAWDAAYENADLLAWMLEQRR